MTTQELLQNGAEGRPLPDPILQAGRLWNLVERRFLEGEYPSAQLDSADSDQWEETGSCAGSVKS